MFRAKTLIVLLACLTTLAAGKTSQITAKRLFIGGLFPIEKNDQWFLPYADVICQMAVVHVNANPSLLPGFELVLRVNDTKCDLGQAMYQMVNQINDRQGNIVALLGAGCSSVTQPLASTSYHWNLLQMTFLSSSPSLLEAKMYPNLFQLLATENALNPARVALLNHLEWKKAIILYEPVDLFTYNAKDLMTRLKNASIEVAAMDIVGEDASFNTKATMRRLKNTKVRIIFGLFYEKLARRVVCMAHKAGFSSSEYTWIFPGWFTSSTWYMTSDDCTPAEMVEAVRGHFTVDVSGVDRYGMRNVPTLVGKTGAEVQKEFKMKTNSSLNNYLAYGYDAVLATAKMLDEAATSLSATGQLERLERFSYNDSGLPKLFKSILSNSSFSFPGLMGNVSFPLRKADKDHRSIGRPGMIDVRYNVDDNSSLVAVYAHIGNVYDEIEPIIWADGEKPLDSPMIEMMFFSMRLFYVAVSFAALGLVFALGLLYFNIAYRNTRLIKLSSPRLNNLMLLGGIMEYFSIVFLGFNGQFFEFNSLSIISCHLHTVLLYGGFVLAFGSMFAKTWRVNKIIKWSAVKARPVSVSSLSDLSLFGMVGVFLLVDIIVFTLAFTISPISKGVDIIATKPNVEFQWHHCVCADEHVWVYVINGYHGLLLVLGGYLAFETRKVNIPDLNDSRLIGISIYMVAVFFVALFGFSFITDPSVVYILTVGAIFLVSTSVLCIVFVPKICKLRSQKVCHSDKRSADGSADTITSVTDHVIARKSDLNSMERRNKSQKDIIVMLLQERHLSDLTVTRVSAALGLPPPSSRPTSENEPSSATNPLTSFQESEAPISENSVSRTRDTTKTEGLSAVHVHPLELSPNTDDKLSLSAMPGILV
eukprot:m.144646 g.144646  ORF g.144646 m.144646 type:complete len:874 (+) comp38404_c0_seq19:2136-4757(+)